MVDQKKWATWYTSSNVLRTKAPMGAKEIKSVDKTVIDGLRQRLAYAAPSAAIPPYQPCTLADLETMTLVVIEEGFVAWVEPLAEGGYHFESTILPVYLFGQDSARLQERVQEVLTKPKAAHIDFTARRAECVYIASQAGCATFGFTIYNLP